MHASTAELAALPRRDRNKLRTRRRIFEAAKQLMVERSFDDVKIEEICELADVANATFFHHFPTKVALLQAFNEDVAEKIADKLQGSEASATEQLRLAGDIILEEWRDNRHLQRRIFAEVLTELGSQADCEPGSDILSLLSAIIEGGQKTGEFRSDFHAETGALIILSAWKALGIYAIQTGKRQRARKGREHALSLLLHGMVAPTPP
jgi:AcrR family transcriptional regulator